MRQRCSIVSRILGAQSGFSAREQDRSVAVRDFTDMLHLHRITTLFCLSIAVLACDVDEHPGLDEFEALDGPSALDARLAESGASARDLATAPAGRHCVVEAIEVPDGVDPATLRSAENPITCFPRFADAIFAITGERLADDVTPATFDPDLHLRDASSTPRVNYVLGVEYDQLGAPYSLTAVASGTCLTASWAFNKLSAGWDNRISSSKAYSGCKHAYHYEHTYLGGAVLDCGTGCAAMGVMDNRTSSLRFTK